MANWAVVIGIDKYWTPEACLKGAVHDALQMREWLLDRKGGDVSKGNLSLLLAPTEPLAEGLGYVEATRSKIVAEITRMLQRSGGKGERLYVHYSGHGLTNRVNFTDEEVLIPTDFNDADPSQSIGLWSLIRRMQATQFRDQFFTIDACRNIPWQGEYVTGSWPWVEKRNPALPAVTQFVFYATSPGVTAAEVGEAGNERGAFTTALLEGLRGQGEAKAWDSVSAEYVVRVDRLFDYVTARLKERQVLVESEAASRLIQIPRLGGERGGAQPVLARFPLEEVNKETLEVYLEPSDVVSVAEVTVERDFGLVEHRTQLPGLPVTFELPPMEYGVQAKAANYEAVQKRWLANLYQPEKVTVQLSRSDSTSEIGDITGDDTSTLSREDSTRQRGLGRRPSRPESTTLIVQSSDHLAPLEVTDTTGVILETGQGRIESTVLGAGYYHARIRMPEGQGTKKLVELGPGETEVVHLDAPEPEQTRLVQEMLEGAGVETKDDHTLKISEPAELGSLASPQVSTLVALAGGVANRGEREVPTARRRLVSGLKGFRPIVGDKADSGLYVLFGFDSHDRDVANNLLSGMKIRFWALDAAVPESSEHLLQHSGVSGLAEYARPAVPGPHWLSVELPGQPPLVSIVTVLPQHLSMLVFDREADGEIRLFQYLPRLEAHVDIDLAKLRQLELIQRFFLQGRLGRAYDLLKASPRLVEADPFAKCIAGYVLLQLGKTDELGSVVETLISSYPELSDSHVLQAEFEAYRKDDDAAVAAYRTALGHGVPALAIGLVRLYEAVHKLRMQHARMSLLTEVFNNRCLWLVWSAWVPPKGLHDQHFG